MSAHPDRRRNNLGGDRHGLILVHVIPAPDETAMRAEQVLHEAFAHRRVIGEWFRLDADEVSLIRSITTAGDTRSFPPAILGMREANAATAFRWGLADPEAHPAAGKKAYRSNCHRRAEVDLPPDVWTWANRAGGGSIKRGLRKVLIAAYEEWKNKSVNTS